MPDAGTRADEAGSEWVDNSEHERSAPAGSAGAQSSAPASGAPGELLVQLITRHLPPDPTRAQVLAVHERVFTALWLQLAPLMGNGGAQTVFARAIQLACRHAPLAAELQSTATAVDFGPLRSHVAPNGNPHAGLGGTPDAAPDGMDSALRALAVAVEDLITNLLGPGLSRSLVRDVERALARQN